MRLEGEVAAVTGSSSGLGRAIARQFAEEGADVLCFDLQKAARPEGYEGDGELDTDDAIRAASGSAAFIKGDVSNASDIQRAVRAATEKFGGLDIMVNNAGVNTGPAAIVEETEQEFDFTLAVNTKGVWLGCKYAIEQMLKQGKSSKIINIASAAALVGVEKEPAYAASKGAILSLTKQLAADYAPHRINVNVICPGYVKTALSHLALTGSDAGSVIAEAVSLTPLPRGGTAEDIAKAALFLASSDADWITGSTLVVDGGYTAL